MGGGSSSSSSTTEQTSTTNQTDRRIGATDSAVVIAPEANSPIDLTVTDGLAYQTVTEAGELIGLTLDRALLSVDKATDALSKTATAKVEPGFNAADIAKWAAIGAVGYGAIKVLSK